MYLGFDLYNYKFINNYFQANIIIDRLGRQIFKIRILNVHIEKKRKNIFDF